MQSASSRRRARTSGLGLAVVVTMVVGFWATPAHASTEIDLTSHFNNVGIQQLPTSTANFDGVGWSYSTVALRLGHPDDGYPGVEPGGTVTAGDFTFTWPDRDSGATDNVQAFGQTIPIPATEGATQIGFLGAATNGPSTGTFTFNYTFVDEQGVPQEESVETPIIFSDWTLNAGGAQPSPNNTIVLKNMFRSASAVCAVITCLPGGCCIPDQDEPHVFLVTAPLDATKTLESVQLPMFTQGAIHLFGMAVA